MEHPYLDLQCVTPPNLRVRRPADRTTAAVIEGMRPEHIPVLGNILEELKAGGIRELVFDLSAFSPSDRWVYACVLYAGCEVAAAFDTRYVPMEPLPKSLEMSPSMQVITQPVSLGCFGSIDEALQSFP